MSATLHLGDHYTPDNYDADLVVIAITDHTADAIGCLVYELIDASDDLWFLIAGIITKSGIHRTKGSM